MDGTILGQGSFSAVYTGVNPNTGVASVQAGMPQIIQIPSGADWVKVFNYTQYGTAGTGATYYQGTANAFNGVEFYWQRGMAAGTGIVKYYAASGAVLTGDTLSAGGFTIYDPTGQSAGSQPVLSNPIATTASTNVTRPVVSTGTTSGISVGSVVRMSNTAQTDVNGIDMVVGAVSAGSAFTLLTSTNALATAPGAIGGAGFYRIVNTDPLFYPRRRYITNITQAANAQVSTSVAHNYVAGQSVRFNIPAVSGMIQLNPTAANNFMQATVVSVVDSYNFTININSTAYTAFTFPTIAQQPSSFPEVTPIGEDTASALLSTQPQFPLDGLGNPIYAANSGILSDATVNTGYLGMILGSGAIGAIQSTYPIVGPAGSVNFNSSNAISQRDLLYWVAGKSTYGGL